MNAEREHTIMRNVKKWGREATIVVSGVLVAAACRGHQISPTSTQTEVSPSPTSDVAMIDMQEVDTNLDGNINMLDLMDQRKKQGKGCLECENLDSDLVISDKDVTLEQARLRQARLTGKYDRRADLNYDGENNDLDLLKITSDAKAHKSVPSTGKFRADDVERGWIANQVGVSFEQGSDGEASIVKLNNLNKNLGSDNDIEETKKKIINSLGLSENWTVIGVSQPPEGFKSSSGLTVTLKIPQEVLKNMTLGEQIDILKIKTGVSNAHRVYLGTLP